MRLSCGGLWSCQSDMLASCGLMTRGEGFQFHLSTCDSETTQIKRPTQRTAADRQLPERQRGTITGKSRPEGEKKETEGNESRKTPSAEKNTVVSRPSDISSLGVPSLSDMMCTFLVTKWTAAANVLVYYYSSPKQTDITPL